MILGDTIVAVASARGASARAVVRFSGPATHETLGRLSARAGAAPGAGFARLALGDDLSFPAMLIRWRAPRSFTGEDAAELLVPGNPHLVDRLLDRALAMPGVRAAGPGEFTARAFLNGKVSAEQAEGVALAIAARSDAERRAAASLLSGETGARFTRWAEETGALLALVEAGIDFTDQEDVVPIAPAPLVERLEALIGAIRQELGPASAKASTDEAVRAALVGAPNAGKSALFNALLGKARAVVADVPGTTRDALAEPLRADGATMPGLFPDVTLVDLAGLDRALAERAGVDALAQRRAADEISRADVLALCDPAGRFGVAAKADVAAAIERGAVALRIRTKADLTLAAFGDATEAADAGGAPPLAVCALDGWNVGALKRAIFDAAAFARAAGSRSDERIVLPRHRAALAAALAALNEALAAVGQDNAARALTRPELIAQRLREALDALGEISGRISPDDVLGRIFASFCIGK